MVTCNRMWSGMCRRLICLIACLNLMLSLLILNSKGPQNMTQNFWSPPPKLFPLTIAIAIGIAIHGQCLFDFLTDTLLSILLSILRRINAFPVVRCSRIQGPLFDVKLSTVAELWCSHGSDVPIIRWASSRRPLLNLSFNSKTQQPDLKIPIKGAAMTGISSNDKLK